MRSVCGRSTRALAVMSRTDAVTSFRALDSTRKIVVLASLGHFITIAAREAYATTRGVVDDPQLLLRANELMHGLIQHISHIARGSDTLSEGWIEALPASLDEELLIALRRANDS